jgi:AcrR family transcriptional regulator
MGSKERIERAKDNIRADILDAAIDMVKKEGWQSLSMRKIADSIEYTPPVIYSYFLNKEAVLIELAKRGYAMLNTHIEYYLKQIADPRQRLEMIMITYMDFAIKEKELYQLINGVGAELDDVRKAFPGLTKFMNLFREEIEKLTKDKPLTEELFLCKYFTLVSFVHGLISVNYYFKDIDKAMNDKILKEGMAGVINSI